MLELAPLRGTRLYRSSRGFSRYRAELRCQLRQAACIITPQCLTDTRGHSVKICVGLCGEYLGRRLHQIWAGRAGMIGKNQTITRGDQMRIHARQPGEQLGLRSVFALLPVNQVAP